jgi:predicted dehydrogenase
MILTRRSFGTLLTAGAATRLAAAPFQNNDRKIGYCIVGLGRISMQHFMPGARTSKRSRVTAIVSGHRDKAEKWAADYGVSARSIYSYENYDAIAENKDIDAVYIALPNSMHAEYSIRAAKAGKHVLFCEKPMAMVDACRKANKKLTANLNGEPRIDEPNAEKDPAQFPREADHLANCILENRQPKTAGEEGLKDMQLMAAIYKSCGRA